MCSLSLTLSSGTAIFKFFILVFLIVNTSFPRNFFVHRKFWENLQLGKENCKSKSKKHCQLFSENAEKRLLLKQCLIVVDILLINYSYYWLDFAYICAYGWGYNNLEFYFFKKLKWLQLHWITETIYLHKLPVQKNGKTDHCFYEYGSTSQS